MWTFDNFPTARVERAYGVRVDQAWLDRVQAASVRFTNGCSASEHFGGWGYICRLDP